MCCQNYEDFFSLFASIFFFFSLVFQVTKSIQQLCYEQLNIGLGDPLILQWLRIVLVKPLKRIVSVGLFLYFE